MPSSTFTVFTISMHISICDQLGYCVKIQIHSTGFPLDFNKRLSDTVFFIKHPSVQAIIIFSARDEQTHQQITKD